MQKLDNKIKASFNMQNNWLFWANQFALVALFILVIISQLDFLKLIKFDKSISIGNIILSISLLLSVFGWFVVHGFNKKLKKEEIESNLLLNVYKELRPLLLEFRDQIALFNVFNDKCKKFFQIPKFDGRAYTSELVTGELAFKNPYEPINKWYETFSSHPTIYNNFAETVQIIKKEAFDIMLYCEHMYNIFKNKYPNIPTKQYQTVIKEENVILFDINKLSKRIKWCGINVSALISAVERYSMKNIYSMDDKKETFENIKPHMYFSKNWKLNLNIENMINMEPFDEWKKSNMNTADERS